MIGLVEGAKVNLERRRQRTTSVECGVVVVWLWQVDVEGVAIGAR